MNSFDYARRYGKLHRARSGKWFSGKMSVKTAGKIASLVEKTKAEDILDYGSGKGYQYLSDRMHEYWGLKLPYCYDIGVPLLSQKPDRVFDGVICCDVLEHIHPRDVDRILNDIFDYVRYGGFAYLEISCRPAKKTFNDGVNLHLTVESPDWWQEKISALSPEGIFVMSFYESWTEEAGDQE